MAVKPDYLSRDYIGLRNSMLQYARSTFPEWQPSSSGDFGVVLVETAAYMGDIISYYTDRAQFENYLPTATQRDSILNLAFMLGYSPNSGSPATGTVTLTTDKGTAAVVVPVGTQVATNRVEAIDGPVIFETTTAAALPANPDGAAAPVVVPVLEGATETFLYLGESNGQPSQSFLLPHTGVYHSTIQIFVEDGAGTTVIGEGTASPVKVRPWLRVEKLLQGDSYDKYFEPKLTANATQIYFGDDINGAIPATGLKIYATYRHGYGSAGNLGVGVVRLINTKGQQNLGAVKVAKDGQGSFLSSAMTGGADPESNDSIRVNAPRVYRTQNRVVTERDFIEVALGTEGVATANAVVGSFTSVTLFITTGSGDAPSDSLKQAVLDRLEGKTLAGVTVTIGEPTTVPISFGTSEFPIKIKVRNGYSLSNVAAAAKREIRALVGRLDFGTALSVNQVYNAINRVPGVVTVDIDLMARVGGTGTARITPKAWEVFSVNNIHVSATRYKRKKSEDDD